MKKRHKKLIVIIKKSLS